MGRLLVDQHDERGRILAVAGGVPAGLMLVWVFAAGDRSLLLWTLIPLALATFGVALGLTGHRIYEDGVEVYSPRGKRSLLCSDVQSVDVKPIRLLMQGIHTRTTYNVVLHAKQGPPVRFQHIAQAGKEALIEDFLQRCRAAA
jgi:hypothetical protein